MGLETGTFISDLDAANPLPADKRRQGDDHLRLIKATIKNTFPNINGAVTVTDEQLNFLSGLTADLQTQLDAKLTSADIDLSGYAQLAASNAWTRTQAIAPVNLGNQSGTIVIDGATATTFVVTLTGNATLAFSNLIEGQSIIIKVIQGGVGSFTLTYPPTVRFSFGVAPVLSSTPTKFDILAGQVIDGQIIFGFLADLLSV